MRSIDRHIHAARTTTGAALRPADHPGDIIIRPRRRPGVCPSPDLVCRGLDIRNSTEL